MAESIKAETKPRINGVTWDGRRLRMAESFYA